MQSSTRVKIRCDFKATPLDAIISFNSQGQIEGFFLVPAEKAADAPGPPYAEKSKFTEEPITVGARDWPLPGTLTRPKGIASPPLVILVHGSGPNDRDETLGPNTPFRDLAQGLATRGIAALRYDKRTFAQKEKLLKQGLDKTITIKEEVLDDVMAALDKSRSLPGIDANRIFVMGHSGGGSLAPLIAQRDGHLAGIILLAASSRPLRKAFSNNCAMSSADPGQAEAVAKLEKEVGAALADEVGQGARRRADQPGLRRCGTGNPAGDRLGTHCRLLEGRAGPRASRGSRLPGDPGRFPKASAPPSAAAPTPRSTCIPT